MPVTAVAVTISGYELHVLRLLTLDIILISPKADWHAAAESAALADLTDVKTTATRAAL